MTSNLTARVLPYLPGSIQGAGGITVTQVGTVWTVGTPPGFSIDGSGNTTVNALTVTSNQWQSWTPVFTAAGGTIGTQTLNRARFYQIGKYVEFYIDVSITSAGSSPTGDLLFTLPTTQANFGVIGTCAGRDLTLGTLVGGHIDGANHLGHIGSNAGATNVMANNARIMVSGRYEAA